MSSFWYKIDDPVYLNKYKFKQGNDEAAFRHKLAMFFAGFIMLTPHRIAMLCANNVIKRYHLPPSVVPLYIYKIHNPMELASFIGTVIQVLLSSAIFTAIAENDKVQQTLAPNWNNSAFAFLKPPDNSSTNTYATGRWDDAVITNCKRVVSIVCGWIMFITSIFTFVFHNCCKYLSNKYNWEDYDYTFVKLLIISTILILFITAAWWTVDQLIQLGKNVGIANDAGSIIPNNSSIGELFGIPREPKVSGNQKCADTKGTRALQAWSHWSPILMLSMSLGTVYAFYPSITPYQLMDVEDANNTDFYVQFISAIPTLVIGVLDEIDCGPGSGDGFNSNNDNEKSSITQWKMYNWYDRPQWNYFWIAAIPYVLCIHIFITIIHFPDGLIATYLHSRPRLLKSICVSFNFWQEILEIVGFSAAGKQSNPMAVTKQEGGTTAAEQIAYNGHVRMVNNFLFLFTMAITMFV